MSDGVEGERSLGAPSAPRGVAEDVREEEPGALEELGLRGRGHRLDPPLAREALVREGELGEAVLALRQVVEFVPEPVDALPARVRGEQEVEHARLVFELLFECGRERVEARRATACFRVDHRGLTKVSKAAKKWPHDERLGET